MPRSSISVDATQYTVASFTDPYKTYTVTEKASPGRPWMCDCPAWIFGKGSPKPDCKHIRSVQLATHPATYKRGETAEGEKVVEVKGEKMTVRRQPKLV